MGLPSGGACNYLAGASVDAGICEFVSCAVTDEAACNYDGLDATIDDGSCEYPDTDGDGILTATIPWLHG